MVKKALRCKYYDLWVLRLVSVKICGYCKLGVSRTSGITIGVYHELGKLRTEGIKTTMKCNSTERCPAANIT